MTSASRMVSQRRRVVDDDRSSIGIEWTMLLRMLLTVQFVREVILGFLDPLLDRAQLRWFFLYGVVVISHHCGIRIAMSRRWIKASSRGRSDRTARLTFVGPSVAATTGIGSHGSPLIDNGRKNGCGCLFGL